MSFLDGLRHRLYVLLRGERYSHEIEREMRFHVNLEQVAGTAAGQAIHDAEISARRALGNATYYREEVRRMTPLSWMDRIRQDLEYAWRGLMRAPGFTTTVVVTLGLGLGVNAAMYSFLDRVFFRPPEAVVAPNEVRRLFVHMPDRVSSTGGRFIFGSFNYPQYQSMSDALGTSASIAAYIGPDSVSMKEGQSDVPVRVAYATKSYYDVLGLRPSVGRFFAIDEDRIDATSFAAVISTALWRDKFGSKLDAIGKTVSVGKQRFTIVGIAPKGFAGVDLDRVDLWLPMNAFGARADRGKPWYQGTGNYLRVIARAPNHAADVRLTTVSEGGYRRGREAANGNRDTSSVLLTGPLSLARGPADQRQELTISTRLAAVALVVLLIACANVANLLVARAMHREREIAVRRALGVSNGRLVGQLLTESLLLVAIAGGFALVLAVWAAAVLRRLLLPGVLWATSAVDWRVAGFTAIAGAVVGVLAGLAPLSHATRLDLINSLRAGSREGAYRGSKLRGALLVIQAALSIVLVVGAGVFVRSLRNVQAIDIGYDSGAIIAAQPYFENPDAAESPAVTAAMAGVATELKAVGAIESVSIARFAPMRGYSGTPLFLPGRDTIPHLSGDFGFPSGNSVSPDYFATTGLRVLQGRTFDKSDQPARGNASPASIIVSATMARVMWPRETAVGKCILVSKRTNPCTTVIGIVDDGRLWRILDAPPMQYYFPISETAAGTLVIRARANAAPVIKEQIRRLVTSRVPGTQTARVNLMTDDLEPQLRPWRLGADLFSAMGLLALIVSGIGIYSVVSYAVSQRTHEMGVRIALGARVSDILNLVVYEGFRIVSIGVAVGVVAALALGRFVASLLFKVSPYDAVVLVTAVITLCILGLIASAIPGWRAARADPLVALRAD